MMNKDTYLQKMSFKKLPLSISRLSYKELTLGPKFIVNRPGKTTANLSVKIALCPP